MERGERWLARPAAHELRYALALALAFLAFFELLYGGASRITALHGVRHHVHLDFELRLPFLPWTALVYLSIAPLLLIAPFVLRTWRRITPLFLTLVVETVAGVLVFLAFPVENGFPPRGSGGSAFALADFLNWEANEVPSLHVAFAVTCALVYGRSSRAWGRGLLLVWAGAIATSTLLMHEHHLVDVLSGALLAVLGVHVVHRRAAADAFLEAWRIELLCLRELAHFARRHPRYLLLAGALYGYSLPRWREARVLRAGYCFVQHVDDVLDGDRRISEDADEYARELARQIREGTQGTGSAASILARAVTTELERRARPGDDPRADLLELLEAMRFDLRRRSEALLLSRDELAAQHRRTFRPSVDLLLLATSADARSRDVEPFLAALAWCSPLRDLGEDLERGLVNVPREVVERALAEGAGSVVHDDLVRTRAVRAWIRAEHRQGVTAIDAFGAALVGVHDARSRRVLRPFHRALASFAGRYARRNRALLAEGTAPTTEGRGEVCDTVS